MLKPKPCQQLVMYGLALSVGGAVCLALTVPAASSSYSNGSYELLVVLGAIALTAGLGFLFTGINRASAGIDYLVAGDARRAQNSEADKVGVGEDQPT